jgi:hypothetical protein
MIDGIAEWQEGGARQALLHEGKSAVRQSPELLHFAR